MFKRPVKLAIRCRQCQVLNRVIATEIYFAVDVDAICSTCGAELQEWRQLVRRLLGEASENEKDEGQ